MKKMKVLHILWSGGIGGAEKCVRDITVYSNKQKFEHTVCFLSQGGRFADEMEKNGVKIYYLGMKSGLSITNGVRFLKIINKVNPNIIHSHCRNYLTNMLVLCFPKIVKVYFEHGGDLAGRNPRREIMFYQCFGRLYDLILANSDYIKHTLMQFNNLNPLKIKTFYNGIDPLMYGNSGKNKKLKMQLRIPIEHKVIGTVCRLVEAKGVDDFIRVASEIRKRNKKFSFVIIGDGSERPRLEKMAVRCSVEIKFLGERYDVPVLLNIFDIFLCTSKWESFGIAILEAMAAKVPVIGFAVPGMREIITKGGGGILIEKRDHKKLAKIAVDLLEDQERYNRISNEGYVNIRKNFDIKKNIKGLEEKYDSLVNQ